MTVAPARERRERLDPEIFDLPVEKMRDGYYTDAYFNHTRAALLHDGRRPRVLMQLFQRHHAMLGGMDESIAILEPISANSLNRKASLGHAYAVAGQTGRGRSVLGALRTAAAQSYVPSYYFAVVHAGLGQRDEAIRYLERAYEERSTVLAYLRIDPRLAPLRNEPRFIALARRLGE